ncbi:MAG: UvrD-helicase domain-containing protein [Coriobacteriia bacterium]|nr:UvrD-helicase domain-containing protein [Coriobacteriia bacterium]
MYLLDNLDDDQRLAVTTTEGYVRVAAGPGSGKTRTLTTRFCYLVQAMGVPASNIVCATFTNKAANEMKKRIFDAIGEDGAGGMIGTFHSIAVKIIREDGYVIGVPKDFQIIDGEDVERIIKSIIADYTESFDIQQYSVTISNLVDSIDHRGESLRRHEDARYNFRLGDSEEPLLRAIDETVAELQYDQLSSHDIVLRIHRIVVLEYIYRKRKSNALDFNDLIDFSLFILEKSESARDKWQKRCQYVMVDEYQDISGRQRNLSYILAGYHHNYFIVGDPDQTIYEWRGANIRYLVDFDKDHPNCKSIELRRNYRSLQNIIKSSNEMIKKNSLRLEKYSTPVRKEDGKVVYFHAKTSGLEAEFVTNNIKAMQEQGLRLSDIAILYRAHHVSRSFEEALLGANLPYRVLSGTGFYQRKEVKDTLAYLRLLVFGDDISFERVHNNPARRFGPRKYQLVKETSANKGITQLEAFIEIMQRPDSYPEFQIKSICDFYNLINDFRNSDIISSMRTIVSDTVIYILDRSGYEAMLRRSGEDERLDNLSELKQSISLYEKNAEDDRVSPEEYLQDITLLTTQDMDDQYSKVQMMTIHTAKGLEFPVVFVVGMNEGILPGSRARNKSDIEQERRLAFVAFTRAMNQLVLTDAEGTNFNGSFKYPSRFIFDTERVGVDYIVELDDNLIHASKTYVELNDAAQALEFSVGDEVHHPILGNGVIVSINQELPAYGEIDFEKTETRRQMNLHYFDENSTQRQLRELNGEMLDMYLSSTG